MFKKVLHTFFAVLITFPLFAQVQLPFKHFSPDEYAPGEIESLREKYGMNKDIPDSYELATLIALSKYPELAEAEIEFVTKSIKTTMAARPKMNLLFKKRNKREYRIFINNDRSRLEGVLLEDVPFDAQVGVIAHELAHILDYSQKSVFRIIGNGIGYISKDFRSDFEKKTDQLTIERGFGWQVHHFCQYLHSSPDVPKSYKNYKKSVYYSPEEIISILDKSDKYKVRDL